MENDAIQEDAIQTRTKENLNNQSQTNNHIKTKVTVKRATTDFENIKTVNKSETPNKNIIGTSRAYKKLTDKDIIKLRKLLAKHDLYHPVVTKSVREMIEDSSLEALDYSDNYTFQTLIFQPEPLTTKEVLDSKTIPFQIHSYLTGANSGDVYKINLQLDPIIANHVKKITVNPSGRSSSVELVRLANKECKATNIWQVNFIRASGGLFGGAEILSQYTAENGKIELDDTVRNILEKMEDHSDKLNYLIYVKDSQENKKIKTSETSGYFLTPSETLINSIVSSNSDTANSAFKASSGAIQFDSDIGEFGGITVDQQILKNGTFNYGGPLIDSGLNKQWRYHYQIDPKLVPYIGSIELHSYDFYGVSGFDKTYYPKNKVADLAIDKDGRGSITSSNLNDLMGIIIIILEIILGIFFIMTGLKILSGAMKQEFAKLGYPPIFNKITGLFELIGGIAMLVGIFYIPLAIFASILLALTMLAGAGSLVFLGKDPIKKAIPAIVLFVLNLIILIYLLIV